MNQSVDDYRLPDHQPSVQTELQYPESKHVYGRSGALCFSFGRKDERHVINIEAANARGPRMFDWDKKIQILIVEREVPHVLAVLNGLQTEFSASHHGQQRDKYFSIHLQQDQVFARVGQGKNCVSVPIGIEDLFYLNTMMLTHISKNFPGCGPTELLTILGRTYKTFNAGQGYQKVASNQG